MKKYRPKEIMFLTAWGLFFFLVLSSWDRGAEKSVLLLLLILAVAVRRSNGIPLAAGTRTRLVLAGLVIYFLVNSVSVLIPSEIPGVTFFDRSNEPFYIIVFILSVLIAAGSREMIQDLACVLIAVVGFYFAMELLRVPWWDSLTSGSRFSGSANLHPNTMGMTLLIMPAMAVGVSGLSKQRVGRALLLAGSAVFTLFLFLTKSRSCLLIFGLVNLPLSVLFLSGLKRIRTRVVLAVLIVALVVPMLSFLWLNYASEDRKSTIGIYGRYEAWQTSLVLTTDGPWYRTFIGHGKYKKVFRKLVSHYGHQSARFKGEPAHAHNSYLQVLVESGILGLTGFLLFLGGIVSGLAHLCREPGQASGLPGILLVSVVTFMAMGVLDNNLRDVPGLVSYGILALAAAYICVGESPSVPASGCLDSKIGTYGSGH